ncbi:hypothetical protein D3C78_1900850 [compost metagenome]
MLTITGKKLASTTTVILVAMPSPIDSPSTETRMTQGIFRMVMAAGMVRVLPSGKTTKSTARPMPTTLAMT